MSASTEHRLTGLEGDNLLGFLAFLGVLRSLGTRDLQQAEGKRLLPRGAWSLDCPPLRPVLTVKSAITPSDLSKVIGEGLAMLAADHDFAGAKDLSYTRLESRGILEALARDSTLRSRSRVDLFAALMSDGAIKDDESAAVHATPLCLLFGQGHQHFLDRLAHVPAQSAPPPRGRGKLRRAISAPECISEALFEPWHRSDPTSSFRWDPEEDVRYALMAGDPTDKAYKTGTQHGANRLAAVGLAALTVAPVVGTSRTVLGVLGGKFERGFSFAWPIWRGAASLQAIRALLSHPGLREPAGLAHLGVENVLVARRISVGKFMNFSRARPLE